MSDSQSPLQVAALYRFTPFGDPAALKDPLLAVCDEGGVKGTILLAHEGINGTIAGPAASIAAALDHIHTLPGCEELEVKFSTAAQMPFHRMKVRLKREIVTMGLPHIDPKASVGRYVDPEDWNTLIADPDTLVIDTRNDYEVAIGTFEGALDPQTKSFRDFPAWFIAHREALLAGKKRVAMFCTGGIRCEKSTSFLRSQGVEDVFHLKGGILKYIETVPEDESAWRGDCFVFDERVTVRHGLVPGDYTQCRACRMPLSAADRLSPAFVEGVSCSYCIDERTKAQREGYAERQRQEELARRRGTQHVGHSLAGKRCRET
ncbi:MAG: rhodanese-related sulfurtransferase [Pseudomonadota bacterium]